MQTPAAHSGNTVFIKTAKGREEIAARRHLSSRERRVLIVIDGKKDLDTLTAMSGAIAPIAELEKILSFLLQQGFIGASTNADGQAHAPTGQAPAATRQELAATALHLVPQVIAPTAHQSDGESALTLDPVVIRQVKDFMTTTTQTYLGLLGAGVIQRIERAQDASQLMAVVGHWHMALHDSKQGTRFAAPYLEQVRQSLHAVEPVRKQA